MNALLEYEAIPKAGCLLCAGKGIRIRVYESCDKLDLAPVCCECVVLRTKTVYAELSSDIRR